MNKRIFMLGDSHIWGTEHIAPDGKICEYPKPLLTNHMIPAYASELPSETTFPYYLDDWKETVNLGWPGAAIDTVRDRFVHHVFEKLEPNDVVSIFIPSGSRKKYSIEIGDVFQRSESETNSLSNRA